MILVLAFHYHEIAGLMKGMILTIRTYFLQGQRVWKRSILSMNYLPTFRDLPKKRLWNFEHSDIWCTRFAGLPQPLREMGAIPLNPCLLSFLPPTQPHLRTNYSRSHLTTYLSLRV